MSGNYYKILGILFCWNCVSESFEDHLVVLVENEVKSCDISSLWAKVHFC